MNTATPPRVLCVIPPMTQLNTPYPSTAYLTGFLRSRGVQAAQVDLALALVLELLSAAGLQDMRKAAQALPAERRSPSIEAFDAQFERYAATITPTIAFLQGRDATLAHRIASRQFLPEGPRFASLDAYVDPDDPEGGDPLAWAFGALGQQDRARHLATLYLNDLAMLGCWHPTPSCGRWWYLRGQRSRKRPAKPLSPPHARPSPSNSGRAA